MILLLLTNFKEEKKNKIDSGVMAIAAKSKQLANAYKSLLHFHTNHHNRGCHRQPHQSKIGILKRKIHHEETKSHFYCFDIEMVSKFEKT